MATYALTVSTNALGLGVLNGAKVRIEKRRVSIADTYPPINNLIQLSKATDVNGVAVFLLEPDDLTTYHVAKIFDLAGVFIYQKSFTMPPSAANLHDASISTVIGGSLIQFKENGNDLGTPTSVRNVDIVGSGVDATFTGDTVTIDVIGGDPAGTSAAEMATHLAALDPHGQYSLETDVTNALALKVNNNAIGAPSGVAPLDENSKVPDQYLSFVQSSTGAVARTVQGKLGEIVSVKDFGAIGDGTLHTVAEWIIPGALGRYVSLAALQADYPHVTATTDSIDWAAIQATINAHAGAFVPKSASHYITNKPITVSANFVELVGSGVGAVIRNIGTGSAVYVTGEYFRIRNISIWGDGGAFGVGAASSHGIEFNNGTAWVLDNVNLRYHGGHGVYCYGGVWICEVTNCEIAHCFGDGVNCVSPSGESFDQNGNGMSVVNTTIALCTGNGLVWKAAAINVSGCVIEANKKCGFLVDTTAYTTSAFGVNFTGNYTENNVLGEMKFVTKTGHTVVGVNIAGNYFYSVQNGPVAAITFVGPARNHRNVHIGANAIVTGGTVVNLVDGGDSMAEDCLVHAGYYNCVNMANATLVLGQKTKVIHGAFEQAGITWGDPTGASANFFSASNVSCYFKVPVEQGNLILDFKFFVESNTTATYSLSATLKSRDVTTGGAAQSIYGISLNSDAGGGNKLFTFTPTVSNLPIRAEANKLYYLHLTFSPPSTGSSIKLHDPVLRYA